jgi:hypothetical protein
VRKVEHVRIRVRCVNCERELLLDEGFAGGTCRCKHCGKIMDVPADAPRVAGPPPTVQQAPPKSWFARNAVALAAVIVVVVTVGVLGLVWMLRPPPPPPPTPEVRGPAFFGRLPIGGRSVALCIDASGSVRERFEFVRRGLDVTLGSLSPRQKYVLLLSDEHGVKVAPPGDLEQAFQTNVRQTGKWLEGILPRGAPDLTAALKRAYELGPEEIFLATDRYFSRHEQKDFLKLVEEHDVPINTVGLFRVAADDLMRQIAEKTGGRFAHLSLTEFEKWLDKAEGLAP